jgi:hypothetical protein
MPLVIEQLTADVAPPPAAARPAATPERRAAERPREALRRELALQARRRERLQAD